MAAPVTQTQSREVVITDGNESVDSSSSRPLRCLRARLGPPAPPPLTYPHDIHRYEKLFVDQSINSRMDSPSIAVNC